MERKFATSTSKQEIKEIHCANGIIIQCDSGNCQDNSDFYDNSPVYCGDSSAEEGDPKFNEAGFYEDPETKDKFEHEHSGDGLASASLTPESVAEGAEHQPDEDDGEDYWDGPYVGDAESGYNGDSEWTEDGSEGWFNDLPTDSDDEEILANLVFNEEGFFEEEESVEGRGAAVGVVDEVHDEESKGGVKEDKENEEESSSSKPVYERQNAHVWDADGNDITPTVTGEISEDDDDFLELEDHPAHDPSTCDHETCHADDVEAAEASIFMVMFSVMAVMLFVMWMMLRRC